MRLTAGTKLGPYEIVDALGAGGMGEVYRARDPRLRRDVAIKVVHSAEADRATWERFEREARAASALSHPNICTVFDTGEADGQPYLVMELLEGQTLKDRIGSKPMEPGAAVAIAMQIADALEAAHAKGILHRDVKPGNVMIVGRGHVKVLDFGLAKQTAVGEWDDTLTLRMETQAGQVLGTPAYLSPEVLQGAKADARSDLWALGVVLYQMLSGQLPFRGSTTLEVSSGILKETPPPLPSSVPRDLRAIVERCLDKHPERRQSAGEARVALEALRGGPAPTANKRTWYWALAAVGVAVAGGLLWWQQTSAAPTVSSGAPASANREANELLELGLNFTMVRNDIRKGQELFERALALDPHFAEARRMLAQSYVVALLNGYSNDTTLLYKADEGMALAARDAPDLITLPASQMLLRMAQGRKDLVPVEQLERVARENPWEVSTATARFAFGMWAEDSRSKELAESTLKAVPLMGPVRMFYGELLRTEGDISGAIRELRRVLEQAPDNITAIQFLIHAYVDRDELAPARALLIEKQPLFARNYMWRQSMALLLAAEGKLDEARATMDQETQKWAAAAFPATALTADIYAMTGDKAKAVEWVEKAVRNGDERVGYFQRAPRLASIRNEPGFRQIVESIEARRKR